jgi:DNA-nicking Smr family endonuclease
MGRAAFTSCWSTMRKAKSEERELWHHAMRGVRRLRGREASDLVLVPPPAPPAPTARGDETVAPAPPAPSRGLDRRSAQRLKRGQMPIEARLDLHGMTQEEAHRALGAFIARSHGAGLRAGLVITGKSGVLYGAAPRWLEEGDNRGRVLAASRAQPQHGGAGALYVLLRRRR